MAKTRPELIWFTWENQRRTNELSTALEAPLCKYISHHNYFLRLMCLSARTFFKLLASRPKRVIAQNPSMALAALVCLLKPLFGFRLIVDRHTNFKFETMENRSLKYRLFHFLSKFTIRKADLTIVTNDFLKNLVEDWGGRGLVLPDRVPELDLAEQVTLPGEMNVAFVCTYAGDEPVTEVIEAARLLDPSTVVHITGDSSKINREVIDNAPANVVFTGFLNEKDYQSLLFSCDTVMALTKQDYTLLCGAYEAVAAGKPLITSNKDAIKSYFSKGAIYTDNSTENIAQSIRDSLSMSELLRYDIRDFAEKITKRWSLQFDELRKIIYSL